MVGGWGGKGEGGWVREMVGGWGGKGEGGWVREMVGGWVGGCRRDTFLNRNDIVFPLYCDADTIFHSTLIPKNSLLSNMDSVICCIFLPSPIHRAWIQFMIPCLHVLLFLWQPGHSCLQTAVFPKSHW